MPIRYKAEHFEFPKRMELPVVKELPSEFERRFYKHEACTRYPESLKFMTNCHHCGGWVPGQAHEHRVNTLDGSRLCGRKGTEYYCPRCGKEIHFSGMMS
jgi:hypothetical protein